MCNKQYYKAYIFIRYKIDVQWNPIFHPSKMNSDARFSIQIGMIVIKRLYTKSNVIKRWIGIFTEWENW